MSSSILKNLIQPRQATSSVIQERSHLPSDESDMLDTLAVVVEHSPIAIAMFDRQMRYILANRQWVKEFNLSQSLPLVGKSQYEVFPKLHPGWKQLYDRALQGYTMRSDHAVQMASSGVPAVLFRCEARPWRQKRDASVAGIVVTCNKFMGAANAEAVPEGTLVAPKELPPRLQSEAGADALDAPAKLQEPLSALDVSGAELPIFILDDEGHVVAANTKAAESSLARGIEEGVTYLWEVLEDESRRAVMKQVFDDSVARMRCSEEVPPQILTVKSSPPAGVVGSLPCRWLLARQGTAGDRWLALGLAGLSPFEAVAKVGIQLPPTTTGTFPFAALPATAPETASADALVLDGLRQDKSRLQAELAVAHEALRKLNAEMRTLRDAEHLLVRREMVQQSVVEALPAGLLVLDETGRCIQLNKALKTLLGHEIKPDEAVEEWLARSCPDGEHLAEVCRIWREDVWRRQLTRTVSLVTADGLLKEIEMRPASLAQNGLLVHFQDVTAHCRLEEQLNATESKFRTLLQENPLPVLIADKSGNVYDLNHAAEELFQKPKVELRRLPVEALLAATGVAARKDALREMKQSGDNRRRLTVALAGDGAPKMHLSLAAIRAADGGPHGTLHFFEAPVTWQALSPATADVIADQKMELPVLELKVREPELLISTSVNGRIQNWTDSATEIFGHDRENAIGRALHELFQPSNASGFYGLTLPEAIQAGEAVWTYFRAEGGRQEARFVVKAGPAGGAQVELWQTVASVTDDEIAIAPAAAPEVSSTADSAGSLPSRPEWGMTDLTREQALMAETHHRVHHHLNILSSLVNVQSNAVTDMAAREALRSTQNRLRAVATLHQHLESLASRPETCFRSFVDHLISSLQESLEVSPPRVQITADIPETAPLPREWLMPLALTLNETLSNALEHGFPDGREGRITVRLEVTGNQASLVIQDDGIGMPDGAVAAAERGMGLKIVSVFAEQMKGQLKILGTPENGTKIEMQFFIAFADN
jgi:two-component sensor histidine kinase/PAS domain-containing protein